MNKDRESLLNAKLEKWYENLIKPLQDICSVFNDFFGEDRVDLQNIITFDTFKSIISITKLYNLYNIESDDISPEIKLYEYIMVHRIQELPVDIINQLSNDVPKKFYDYPILSAFEPHIIIHFPQVKVTNENDKSTIIRNLWAKVYINYDGKLSGTFLLNRSEYTINHFINEYMHSHVRHIPKDDFTQFQQPCLGNGPIKNTCLSLNMGYDLNLWNLFCLELNKFVETESINGVPYHYLEELVNHDIKIKDSYTAHNSNGFRAYNDISISKFVEHIIHNNILRFSFVNGSYTIGMSFYEFIIKISNEFIEHYKEFLSHPSHTNPYRSLLSRNIIRKCVKRGNELYVLSSDYTSLENLNRYIGQPVCKFKGESIRVTISDSMNQEEANSCHIFNPAVALAILTVILKVLNCQHGRYKVSEQNNTKIWFV